MRATSTAGAIGLAITTGLAAAQPVGIMSISSAGVLSTGANFRVAVSRDGRHVFFTSRSTNLVTTPVLSGQQVFAHDRDPDGNGVFDEGNGLTTLMSIGVNGQPGDQQTGGFNGQFSLDCSADGRFFVWQSHSMNLVPNDGTGRPFFDVFVRDRDPDGNGVFDEGNGVTERVNPAFGGGDANSSDNGADEVGISDDGRYVVFSSSSRNLVQFDVNSIGPGIYLRDRQAQTTTALVPTGVNTGFRDPQISGDGQWVIYAGGDRLDPVNGSVFDLWAIRRTGGAPILLSRDDNGVPANNDSGSNPNSSGARISRDGRFVVYTSFAGNLDVTRGVEAANFQKIFLHDRDIDGNGVFDEPGGFATRRIDLNDSNVGASGFTRDPDISDDGSRITFLSFADNLSPFDTLLGAQGADVFLYEPAADRLTIASRNESRVQANAGSFVPKISGDGRAIVFQSFAFNLNPNDTNSRDDIFAKTLGCNAADLAAPFGVLSQTDVAEFVVAFFAGEEAAGALLAPAGIVSQNDVSEFVRLFFLGC